MFCPIWGGIAKDEIKLCPLSERNTAEEIIKILESVFGNTLSMPERQRLFFERKQAHFESLREYSHALLKLYENVQQLETGAFTSKDKALSMQFSESVRDPILRRELKQIVRTKPDITFIALRDEAIKWSEEQGTSSLGHRMATSSETTAAKPEGIPPVDISNILNKQ